MPLSIQGPYLRHDIAPTPGASPCALECARTWLSIVNADGSLNRTYIDKQLDRAKGLRIPLILTVVNSNPWNVDTPKAVPEGIPGKMITFRETGKDVFACNENDPGYQLAFDKLLALLGAAYDGQILVTMRYGCGGEGTVGGFHSPDAPAISASTSAWMIQAYRRHFPKSQKFAMCDDPAGVAEAMKDPACGLMCCSLGAPNFDDRMAEIAYLVGPLGKRPFLGEYYGPSSDMVLANRQIARWKVSAIGDWNHPTTADANALFLQGARMARFVAGAI